MAASVTRAMKFRLYPTARQHTLLASMMAAHAEVYNAALQERRGAWKTRGVSVTATSQMAQLTAMLDVLPMDESRGFLGAAQSAIPVGFLRRGL